MDWEELGRALKAARRAAGLKQSDVAARLGISLSSVQAIERGTVYAKPTPTIRALAAAVGWADGSVERVLGGGEPTLARDEPESSAEPSEATVPVPAGTLPLRIVADLTDEGALLDTAVIRLPGGGQAVVVVKGKAGGTPAEIQEALEAWRRTQPQLQGLLDDEPPAAAGA
ncbi:helix-turn-helix domain-containing protein [Streptomyces sp. NPDC056352]|uniref:helix-turn-helix domain-containing protein n=1 Tax=Streptomyces sp. NPDC056352 TaxID=3345791 RepID=UPI0035DA605F